ncbi:MAG: Si-specific NAD(P)(+) transhydrogenase [SAR324 cluster bacterium]|nr:Si-specific NAD(P)(+) transhydrogenase [SAR324 cluster bacterium]MBF0349607.1 Si-specific NAD(P)(+) transhydrogenase [SAR324 cluster bacterium]
MQESMQFDIAVIGSGPAGEKAAMQAAKLGKKVVLIEKNKHIGGASLHTGTIPSKSLRETVVDLELLHKMTHGIQISYREGLTTEEFMSLTKVVIDEQESLFHRNLSKNQIPLIFGTSHFKSAHQLEVVREQNPQPLIIEADYFVLATGSHPHHPVWAPFDNESVFDSDTILQIKHLPKKITIIGAGVIGCEYACIFSKLGIRVNLIARDRDILNFLDGEIVDTLVYRMRNQRITLRLGESVRHIEKISQDEVHVHLDSGKILPCSTVMVAAGRRANTEGLGLEQVGIEMSPNGPVAVNENYQTTQENIYAVGDIIGFPALASTAMTQARIAVLHAFGELHNEKMPTALPFGIWTIPAIAMAGKTEEELTDMQIPYEVGIAHFKEVVRAKIMGDDEGILKLLFDPGSLKLLGVHIIGPRATELIHLGQAVLYFEGTVKYFMNAVFNYPTLDEAYRIAAFNGVNRLRV